MNRCGVRVREVSYHAVRVRTRMPFRYGIAELREMPHLFVRVGVEVGGNMVVGVGADNLPPKWFTKDPGTTYEEDLKEMGEVIRGAGRVAVEVGERGSVFEWWREVYGAQRAWGEARGVPGLLWGFGVSLVERAMMDAFCRGEGVAFGEALRSGRLGLRGAGELRKELAGVRVAELLPGESRGAVAVRHTVGLSDPLVAGDVGVGERLEDGLPQTLEEVIREYGVRYFKIKLAGDVGRDGERLRRLAELLEREVPEYGYTLDGNENFREVGAVRELWESLAGERGLERFLSRVMFVEQPLHREVALSEGVGSELRAWAGRPAMIIDESDGEMGSLPAALAMGYVGTSHKNCKGVFKGVGNYCLIEKGRREGRPWVLSGEDLTNIGPVALMQDLAVLAALGVGHAERNGQHYVRGLEAFPREVQEGVVAGHPDLYRWRERGYAAVRVVDGQVSTRSVSRAPFGYASGFDPKVFPEWEG